MSSETSPIAQRIAERLSDLGLDPTPTSKRAGLSASGIRNILEGKSKSPRGESLVKLAGVLKTTVQWLANGEGDKELPDGEPERIPLDQWDPAWPQARASVATDDSELPAVPPNGVVELDVRAGLGGGGLVQTQYRRDGDVIETADAIKPDAWIFPPSFLREQSLVAPNLVVIETRGDSMSPTINSGERVIVDLHHRIPSPDGLYALRDRFGLIVVKRLHVPAGSTDGVIKIISDNPSHPMESATIPDIEIVGRVVGSWRRF